MSPPNQPSTHKLHSKSDDDEIQILDEIPPKTRTTSSKTPQRTTKFPSSRSVRVGAVISKQPTPAVTSNPYPRVDYSISKKSVTHGHVIDPLDFSDTSEKSSEDGSTPLNPFSAARIFAVKNLKYQGDTSPLQYLPLSFEEARKEKLSKLSPADNLRVKQREIELQKAFKDDCATQGYFAHCFINKNKNLEKSLQNVLNETLKDLESKYMRELDIYTDLFITKSTN
uniref:Periphilin-1 C-terminal domain-containing protein n=1 Tax=Panagrolaimus superbus TaxID=310955 RepID=A0A914YB94_9BILA